MDCKALTLRKTFGCVMLWVVWFAYGHFLTVLLATSLVMAHVSSAVESRGQFLWNHMFSTVFTNIFHYLFHFAWCILTLRYLKHSFCNGKCVLTPCDRVCDQAFARSGLLRSGTLPCDRVAIAIGQFLRSGRKIHTPLYRKCAIRARRATRDRTCDQIARSGAAIDLRSGGV